MHDLVELVGAGDATVSARNLAGTVQPVRQDPVEDVVDERRLAGSAHPGDRGEGAEREVDVDAAEVVRLGPLHRDHALGVDGATPGRHRDLPATRQVVARERLGVLQEVGIDAGMHDRATVHAGAGADVDDPVGGADGVLVVLDHDERVAEVAQGDERVDEAPVVALVEADARLVEHVEHSGEARADLRREADALRLAAGEGGGGT